MPPKRAGKRQAVRTLAKRAMAIMGKGAQTQRMSKIMFARAEPYISRRHAREVRDRLGENKYFDTSFAQAQFGSDATAAQKVTDLAIVPQGNTVNTRIGKKIRCLRLALRGNWFMGGTGTGANPTTTRLSIVWDREPDKAALVPVVGTDIYLGGPTSLTNRDNAPRFKILKSEIFDFPPWASAAATAWTPDGTINRTFDWFLDFTKKDLEVIWTKADTTGATAAKIKGNLLLCVDSDYSIANSGMYLSWNARLDYEDEASKRRK